MIRIDDLLEPLQKQFSRYPLIESLFVVHAYMQHLQFGNPMPDAIEMDATVASKTGYDRNYYEWELDLLALELLRHAPMLARFSLTRWSEFANTLNMLEGIGQRYLVARRRSNERQHLCWSWGRIAYREFPWQEHPNHWRLTRYYKIFFSDPAVDSIISAEIGLTARELYLLGLAFTGHFLTKVIYPYPADLSVLGISDEKRRIFTRRFSRPLSELSRMAAESELRDENFNYSVNPLRIFPMAHVGFSGKHVVIAPIPTYLFHRFTAGLYYELTDNRGFGNALGDSFQRYIGDVLKAALPVDVFVILAEEEYHIGKNRKDTIDWIASDAAAHLFVECKTKRMRLSSRIALADTNSLASDVAKIADFVVQAYKTINDARSRQYPHWRPDARPVYPGIVLLEDWYLFDFRLEQALEKQIAEKLGVSGIDPSVMVTSPYSICSSSEFEILAQVIAVAGIAPVLQRKHTGERTKWNMKSFLLSEFGDAVREIGKRGLFDEALDPIHPALQHSGSLENP